MGENYKNIAQILKRTLKRIVRVVMGMILLVVGLAFSTMAQESERVLNTPQRKSCRIDKNGSIVDFTVTGRMPAGTMVTATPVERTDADGTPMLVAYDITLTDNGRDWQPAY